MEDVYFERIAGVAERGGKAKRPPQRPPRESEAVRPAELDDNGFPLSPLKEQDQLWFMQAGGLYRPLLRCAGAARSSGLLLIFSGILTAAGGALMFDPVVGVIGLIIATLGTMERGAAADVAAAKLGSTKGLVRNQLVLFAMIAAYCVVEMQGVQAAHASTGLLPPDVQQQLEQLPQEASEFVASIEAWIPRMVYGFYGLVLLVSLVVQGSMAFYYFTVRNKVRRFHEELPPWVVDIVKTIANG